MDQDIINQEISAQLYEQIFSLSVANEMSHRTKLARTHIMSRPMA